ncbi:hypothetical protein D9757_007597 [Collybiopsis confluens]|uniref:RING-type domain-containing protein n=1 Tax=Collybiopsis confluens TaxID=2823264 RepID=A0A8H5HEZ3_9AGAR|nr:hypothetical protein D9757_007597 [Collybiopsis confluens]
MLPYSSLQGWDDESRVAHRRRSDGNWWFNPSPSSRDDDSLEIASQLVPSENLSQIQSQSPSDDIPQSGMKGKGKAKKEEQDDDDHMLLAKSSKSKGKQRALPPTSPEVAPDILAENALSKYTCPICFCPPTNTTMTPCGHVACGSCLFTAVKTALRRENRLGGAKDDGGPRCPVCRAIIPGWDGKGGGVIGLVMQTVTITN